MKKSKTKNNGRQKTDYKLVFISVDRETGEQEEIHPRDLPSEKRSRISDKIAEALGYERVK